MLMKTKLIITAFFLFLTALFIFGRIFFFNSFCKSYSICEWGTYLFSVPIAYLLYTLFSKTPKSSLIIGAVTLGAIIQILLTRDWVTGLILQKIIAALSGGLIAFLITKLIKN